MTKDQLLAFENFLEWLDSYNVGRADPLIVGDWARSGYHKWYKDVWVYIKYGEEYLATTYLCDADELDYQAACGTARSLLAQNRYETGRPNPITVYRNEYGRWLWTCLTSVDCGSVDVDKDADELTVLTKVCKDHLSVK